jgi:drug/metabolite transporter (DMT)-like permease
VSVSGLLALLAAAAFAAGSALQQRGALRTSAGQGEARFLVQLWRQPAWLLGALLQAAGWVLQAIALHEGSLVRVQVLITLSLVIALPFGAWLTEQRITAMVWFGAIAVVVGITVFLSVGSPGQGADMPDAKDWWSAGLVSLIVIVVLAAIGRSREAGVQAMLYGCAAGVAFGLQAAITKVFTNKIGDGLSAVLGSWEIYVLIATALAGFALQQSALKTGALAPAIASANAMTLLSSIALGLTVFGESLHSSGGLLLAVIVGLALILVGVVVLARAPTGQSLDVGGPSAHADNA